jgi:hypothetical protein
MTRDERKATGPGQARQEMDAIEDDLPPDAAETSGASDEPETDWAGEVPGSGEPPD